MADSERQRRQLEIFPELVRALDAVLAYEDDKPPKDTYGAEVYSKAEMVLAEARKVDLTP